MKSTSFMIGLFFLIFSSQSQAFEPKKYIGTWTVVNCTNSGNEERWFLEDAKRVFISEASKKYYSKNLDLTWDNASRIVFGSIDEGTYYHKTGWVKVWSKNERELYSKAVNRAGQYACDDYDPNSSLKCDFIHGPIKFRSKVIFSEDNNKAFFETITLVKSKGIKVTIQCYLKR